MTPPESPPESTPEQPDAAVAARHGTQQSATEPASTEGDSRTPEARLLSRKGSTQYLDDVRSLIAKAERLERDLEDATSLLTEQRERLAEYADVIGGLSAEVERLRRQYLAATVGGGAEKREFGAIRTTELRDG